MAVLVKTAGTVALVAAALSWSCTRPAKEYPAGSAAPSTPPPAAATADGAGTEPARPAGVAGAPPVTAGASGSIGSTSDSAATPAATGSSAYLGCGVPIPTARLWDETTESEVLDAISAAKTCAAEHGRRLLLEFVAPWCADCQEMAKLDETPIVAETLQQRFERVRVNVGKWDRHEALRDNFDVRALATYIVIDPKTSKQLAKTTLEPITKKGQKLSAEQWAHWLRTH